MILSMTGFGAGSAAAREVEIDVTVRSLNGRFLEMRCHLPRELAGMENDIKNLLQQQLVRGTVDVYINRRVRSGVRAELDINLAAAKQFVSASRQLGKNLGIEFDLQLQDILTQPEIVTWRQKGAASGEKQMALKALRAAVQKCQSERRREGQAMAKHLDTLIKKLAQLVAQMETQAANARMELGRRLEDRLVKSPVADKLDPQRLAQELAIYLDRADVAEELHRLQEHLKQCHQLLKGQEPAGKRLDFYSQELLREVNTIGSKSPLPQLTQIVVEAKTVIEQLKEQVQNIV